MTDENQSTHLWIVNRALDILAKHTDVQHDSNAVPTAYFLEYMKSDACRSRWQQGLLDADFKHEYNNANWDTAPGATWAETLASGATYKSHFYDPDTGVNWKGESDPTALTEARRHFTSSLEVLNNHNDWSTACYEFGLSLHYLTDTTQPMHAANFTGIDFPRGFHSHYESFVVTVHSQYACGDWDSTCNGGQGSNQGYPTGDEAQILQNAAHYAKPMSQFLVDVGREVCIDRACCSTTPYSGYFNHCWETPGDPLYVGDVTALALKNAQRAAAQYIWYWFSTL